jgi:CubicO group peptidase (beta-lactamase class C family)
MKYLLILFLVLIGFLPSNTKSTNQMEQIESKLQALVDRDKTPSVQYLFFDQDSILTSFQSGYSKVAAQQEVDEKTTYSAFSVTKTFTALAILQLQEKGVLNIEDSVSKYLKDQPYGSDITIKQLMTHSAGIPNPLPLSWVHLQSEADSFDRNEFFEPIFVEHYEVKSEPNEKFAYSNLGYVLLGQIIEEVSSKTYEEYVSELIISRLSIPTSELSFSIENNENHATGYHKRFSFSNLILGFMMDKSKFYGPVEGKWNSFNNLYLNGAPHGGLIGTPQAFVTYLQALMNDDSGLISEDSKTLLFKENETNNGKKTGMALGWFVGELEGQKYLAHAGGGGGYYCEIRIYPDINRGSVIFFNRSGMTDERILDEFDVLQPIIID